MVKRLTCASNFTGPFWSPVENSLFCLVQQIVMHALFHAERRAKHQFPDRGRTFSVVSCTELCLTNKMQIKSAGGKNEMTFKGLVGQYQLVGLPLDKITCVYTTYMGRTPNSPFCAQSGEHSSSKSDIFNLVIFTTHAIKICSVSFKLFLRTTSIPYLLLKGSIFKT